MTFISPPSNILKLIATACVTAMLGTVGYAASIVVAAEQFNGLADEDGNLLPVGSQVRVGVFSLTDSAIRSAADDGNYAALQAGFSQMGAVHVGDSYGIPGYFAGEVVVPANNDSFANAQVYLWVFKTSNNLDPDGTYSNVLETGVFWLDKSVAGGDEWRFRPQSAIPNKSAIDLANLTGGTNNLIAGAHVAAGSFTKIADGGLGAAKQFSTQRPIPEPTSMVLLGIGLVSLFTRRTRK